MGRKPRRKFSQRELDQIEAYATVRLPITHIATLMGLTREYFEELVKRDSSLRLAMDAGQARSSAKFRNTLYRKAVEDKDTKAMIFWGQTQEGMKTTDVVEFTGPGGTSLDSMSDDSLRARVEKIMAKRKPKEE